MATRHIVENMQAALAGRLFPAVTRWNRLEGRPRTHDFSRALKAEVRDALWLIARQWQTGEFHGDDAGSPVLARVCVERATIDRFQAASGPVQPLDLEQPLETMVERRPLPLRAGAQHLALDLRIAVGRRWLKLLARDAAAGTLSGDYRQAYVDAYPVHMPDPAQPVDALVCAHAEAWQHSSLAAERCMDGVLLLTHVANPANHAFDGIGAATTDEARLTELASGLARWFAAMFTQPSGMPGAEDAWLASRLEYQFTCAASNAAGQIVMRAEEYYQGHLDWYALERRPTEAPLGEPPAPAAADVAVHTFMPAPIAFEGMPNTRWWAFEDRRTNFGQVRPDTTDLGTLLLMEFALVYANDWCVLPYELNVGTVAEVVGIAVRNVFGERLWIEPVREQPAADWQRWSMFTLGADRPERQRPPARLVLLPTVPKVQEGEAIEDVAFIRDEMANMVWGIERRIQLASGATKRGQEAARELAAFLQQPLAREVARLQARRKELEAIPEQDRTDAQRDELAAVVARLAQILPPDPAAPIRYRVMSSVPEHWIPFLPVHRPGNVRDTQLQRAALLRILTGDPLPPEKIRPRTTLLRERFPQAYYLNEEEVPRAGAVVTQSYQRTRWVGGRVFTWFGARKQTGRGEGWSGLGFDEIKPAR